MRYAKKVGRLKEVDIFMSMKKKFDTKYSLEFKTCVVCEFISYWKGTEKQTNSHRTVNQAEKETLYQKAYMYGALNRIILEKDIDKSKEICYTYDNNGNILTKSVNGVVTAYVYEEGTDRLTSYGAETIEYDGMGNLKSYRIVALRRYYVRKDIQRKLQKNHPFQIYVSADFSPFYFGDNLFNYYLR